MVESKKSRLNEIGDIFIMLEEVEGEVLIFNTHKVDNELEVVYYYKINGEERSIDSSKVMLLREYIETFTKK
jgi:hypothetical protein